MYIISSLPLFIGNIRGWQLVIILMVIMLFILVPALFGFVLGRKSERKQHLRHRR